jgi:hypothetical protein
MTRTAACACPGCPGGSGGTAMMSEYVYGSEETGDEVRLAVPWGRRSQTAPPLLIEFRRPTGHVRFHHTRTEDRW